MGRRGIMRGFRGGNVRERNIWIELVVGGMIILKFILKWVGNESNILIWFWIGISSRLF
jgi:hypothetical protein